MSSTEKRDRGCMSSFFGVLFRAETWKSELFLLFSFPIAVIGFVLSVVFIACGVSLIILACVGLGLLFVYFFILQGLDELDVFLMNGLLGTEYRARLTLLSRESKALAAMTDRIKFVLTRAPVYQSILYWLIIKFALGIFNFVFGLCAIVVPISLMIRPWLNKVCDECEDEVSEWMDKHPVLIVLLPIAGVLLLFVMLHLVNAVGRLNAFCGRLIGYDEAHTEHQTLLPGAPGADGTGSSVAGSGSAAAAAVPAVYGSAPTAHKVHHGSGRHGDVEGTAGAGYGGGYGGSDAGEAAAAPIYPHPGASGAAGDGAYVPMHTIQDAK